MTRLGPLALEITGDHPVRRLVVDELSSSLDAPVATSLELRISSRPEPFRNAVRLSGSRLQLRHSVSLDASGDQRLAVGIKHGSTLYTVDLHADGRGASVYLAHRLGLWAKLTAPIVRLVSRDSSTLMEAAAKNVIYEIIDSLAAYRLLDADASLMHASGLARNGRAIVLAGTGGVGKSTSLLAAMASSSDLAYVSDDMVIVDTAGSVYRHPKRIQVYAYNVAHLPESESAVMAHLTPRQQRRWQLRARMLGPKQARVRLKAEQLFGADRVVDHSRLGAAVWVTPTPLGTPDVRPIEPEQLARRCAIALVDELWDFARLLNLASLLTPDAVAITEFQAGVADVMAKALGGVPCYELSVPYTAVPEELADRVVDLIDW